MENYASFDPAFRPTKTTRTIYHDVGATVEVVLDGERMRIPMIGNITFNIDMFGIHSFGITAESVGIAERLQKEIR